MKSDYSPISKMGSNVFWRYKIMEIALGIALIVLSVALTVMVLFQSAKDTRLSGTIAGGAETFFGKTKGSSIDKLLSKLTIVVAILVVILTVALVIVTKN